MPSQPIDRKRCVSCKRWGGPRKPGARPGEVDYEDDARGQCNEGPWHGTLRSPRNACGQWVMWAALASSES